MNFLNSSRKPRAMVAALALLIHAAAAFAIPIEVDAPIPAGALVGAGPGGFGGWFARYVTEQNGNTLNVVWNPIVNRLDLRVTFNEVAPIVINFIQRPLFCERPSPVPGFPAITVPCPPENDSPQANGGLNVIIREFITNASDVPWSAFRWVLSEDSPVPAGQGAGAGDLLAHPIFPHFHNALPVGGGFLPFLTANNFDPQMEINLSNGPFPDDAVERTWESVRLHNREVAGLLRTFTLTQYPIPEPSSVALLGIGVSILFFRGRQRRKTAG